MTYFSAVQNKIKQSLVVVSLKIYFVFSSSGYTIKKCNAYCICEMSLEADIRRARCLPPVRWMRWILLDMR